VLPRAITAGAKVSGRPVESEGEDEEDEEESEQAKKKANVIQQKQPGL
jgi:hypothetical protein